jgi:hypothetical protein
LLRVCGCAMHMEVQLAWSVVVAGAEPIGPQRQGSLEPLLQDNLLVQHCQQGVVGLSLPGFHPTCARPGFHLIPHILFPSPPQRTLSPLSGLCQTSDSSLTLQIHPSHFRFIPHTSDSSLTLQIHPSHFKFIPHTSDSSLTLQIHPSHFRFIPHTSDSYLTLQIHPSHFRFIPHTYCMSCLPSGAGRLAPPPHPHTHTPKHAIKLSFLHIYTKGQYSELHTQAAFAFFGVWGTAVAEVRPRTSFSPPPLPRTPCSPIRSREDVE